MIDYPEAMCSVERHDLLTVWEITDIILETVQDNEIVTMED